MKKMLQQAMERAQQAEARVEQERERAQRAEERAERVEERDERAEERVRQQDGRKTQSVQQAEARGNELLMRLDRESTEHETLAVQKEERKRDPVFYGWQMSCLTYASMYGYKQLHSG